MKIENYSREGRGEPRHSHWLRNQLDQFEDETMGFSFEVDERLRAANMMKPSDMARLGASRAFISIHALFWHLQQSTLEESVVLADQMIARHGDGLNDGFDPRGAVCAGMSSSENWATDGGPGGCRACPLTIPAPSGSA